MIIIDEVAMVKNFKENWQQVIRPTLTDRRGTGLFLSTPKGFNHWYDLYNMEQQDRDYKSFTFTTYDNPHIPIDEIEKAKLELTEDAFAQEYMGDFRKHTGLVFKDFDRKVHVKDFDIKPKYQMYCGQDFGWKNPTVVLYSYFDDDDVWYIFDEYYQTELPVDQHAGRIQAKRMQYHNVLKVVYGDSEDPQQIREYQNYNWYITPVIKGSDSILTGIGRIEERLKINAITKEPRMYIHPKCTNLISELERYRWQSNRDPDLNQKETPEKAFDHAIDAMRYIINSYVKEQKKPTPLQGRPVRPIMYVPMGGVRPPQKKKKLPFTLLY
jgi:phage terminase large subunit